MKEPFYKTPKFIYRLGLIIAVLSVLILIATCSLDYYAGSIVPTATSTSTQTPRPTKEPTQTPIPTETVHPSTTPTATEIPEMVIYFHDDIYQALIRNGYLCQLDMDYSETLFETSCWDETNTANQIQILAPQWDLESEENEQIIQVISLIHMTYQDAGKDKVLELFEVQLGALTQMLSEQEANEENNLRSDPEILMSVLPEIAFWLASIETDNLEMNAPVESTFLNMTIQVENLGSDMMLRFIFNFDE